MIEKLTVDETQCVSALPKINRQFLSRHLCNYSAKIHISLLALKQWLQLQGSNYKVAILMRIIVLHCDGIY